MAEELSWRGRTPALGNFGVPMRSQPGEKDAAGITGETAQTQPRVAGAGVGGAASHSMLGAWTLSSKQWGVTRRQRDLKCTLERLLWG